MTTMLFVLWAIIVGGILMLVLFRLAERGQLDYWSRRVEEYQEVWNEHSLDEDLVKAGLTQVQVDAVLGRLPLPREPRYAKDRDDGDGGNYYSRDLTKAERRSTVKAPGKLKSASVVMPMVVSSVVLAAVLFIILWQGYGDAEQKWALGAVGTILGFWLRR